MIYSEMGSTLQEAAVYLGGIWKTTKNLG